MSATPVAVMFQMTSEELTGMMSPLGKLMTRPAPIVAGRLTLLKKYRGTVGAVPHASAVCALPVGSAKSSGMTVTGLVGVTPIACGRPIPNTLAVAAAIVIVISSIFARSVAVVLISRHGFAMVTFDVLFDIE